MIVGLSNILDRLLKKLNRREKVQRLHRDMVSALVMTSELRLEINKRKEFRMIV